VGNDDRGKFDHQLAGQNKAPTELLRRGLLSLSDCVKKATRENWGQDYLTWNGKLWQLLTKIDADFAEVLRILGCAHCGGKLHRSDYERKPRGAPDGDSRDSFCCDQEGCRRRHTPMSVRFLGRRVYPGFVVVLVSAMVHGLKPERVRRIREVLGIDRRTLERWREWWLTSFAGGSFWKAARARFMPLVCEKTLPWSLGRRFEIERPERLLDLLRFLAPVTTPATGKSRGI
jgi:hypothetical protein